MEELDLLNMSGKPAYDLLDQIRKRIVSALPSGWGFILMIFDTETEDQGGINFFTSNIRDPRDPESNEAHQRLACWILGKWLRRRGFTITCPDNQTVWPPMKDSASYKEL